ncbi:MAG: hypothetical protein EXR43_01965 [Dehalococcoidia bacterium]|nr:hypothetical protein [Dehalococcoidia bacterium]
MRYEFKQRDELVWAALVAAVVAVLQVVAAFDPAKISDWRLWAASLGAGALRAAAGALLARLAARL